MAAIKANLQFEPERQNARGLAFKTARRRINGAWTRHDFSHFLQTAREAQIFKKRPIWKLARILEGRARRPHSRIAIKRAELRLKTRDLCEKSRPNARFWGLSRKFQAKMAANRAVFHRALYIGAASARWKCVGVQKPQNLILARLFRVLRAQIELRAASARARYDERAPVLGESDGLVAAATIGENNRADLRDFSQTRQQAWQGAGFVARNYNRANRVVLESLVPHAFALL